MKFYSRYFGRFQAKHITPLFTAFALATAGIIFTSDQATAAEAAANTPQALVGKRIPKVDLSKAAWGEEKMPKLAGKIVVIDISTLGCAPCTAAMPHNTALYNEFKKDGLVVIGLAFGGSEKAMRQFEKKHGVEYPTAFADVIRDDIKKAWHTPYFPYFIVVDRKGVVRGAALDQAGAAALAKSLLKEQPAAK